MSVSMFDSLQIRGVTFPNRMWVSPMCQYSAIEGVVGDWHRVHLGALSSGGAGLVMVEATAVVPKGRISVACPGIWDDAQAEAFRPIVAFSHSMGVPIGIQLAHAGRKGSTMSPWDDHVMATTEEGGWKTDGPSAIGYGNFPIPHSMTVSEITSLTQEFVAAGLRAHAVGFDVLELHAAHGYLFHQFLSPLSNLRTDGYGGSFEGRARFLLETATALRTAIPDSVPLFVRISATDWAEGGWAIEESVRLSRELKEFVSTGGLVDYAKIPVGPGYQVQFAETIRKETGILTSAVGLITEPHQAEEIITSGKADAVMLARAMLRNPHWPMWAAEELGVRIPWQQQFERARRLAPRPSPQ
ncbi:MAG: NADH:flavin oxidoreductase/NADH oxidase [Actinobacteria bacterium]|nr:NADH:flavin oxidoreductase/NADH oxidase [Actinomycetota bacterium]